MTKTANNSTRLLIALIVMIGAWSIVPSPALAAECPNEQVRHESTISSATGQPYDLSLPECRAYEMVSPLGKDGSDAKQREGIPVAADGEAAGFFSQNGFGSAENYSVGALGVAANPYIARRTTGGWTTSSALAPIGVIPVADGTGLSGDASPENFSSKSSCGVDSVTNQLLGTSMVCALRGSSNGPWVGSPLYPNTNGIIYEAGLIAGTIRYLGSSADLSHVLFESDGSAEGGAAFLSADVSTFRGDGLYEIRGLGGSPELSLVNVGTNGSEIGPDDGARLGGISGNREGLPTPCTALGSEPYDSSAYHAISESGAILYFTACPSNMEGGVNTLYARREGRETIAISSPSPSQCTTCGPTEASAAFEGASADGSKAFFLTTQQLVNADTDSTMDLYEYDFNNPPGKNLIQISGGGAGDLTPGSGANVQGVVRTSSDGSHAYFVATGALTTIPNSLGQVAQPGADNLYAWERDTDHPEGQTRFVAELCSNAITSGSVADSRCPASLNGTVEGSGNDTTLWGVDGARRAQTTPDGRYLVFDTYAHLITTGAEAELPEDEAQQVYRYDSQTGELVRVSIGESSFPASKNGNTPGMNATITAPNNGGFGGTVGAFASVNDWSRAISASGSTIVFSTPEQLQANDTNTGVNPSCSGAVSEATGCDVYEWHEGIVQMLSDGQTKLSADTEYGAVGMSESGSDIFLFTRTGLVGQDTDNLVDVYDVRVDGGFPAPASSSAGCVGEACQGNPSQSPAELKPEGSSTQSAAGDLVPPPFTEVKERSATKQKALTNAQKLAAALKTCKKKSKKQRTACERQAHKKYAPSKSKRKTKK
jgi:hypothetical protein